MKNLIDELKHMKNATNTQYEEIINSYSKNKVLKELKDAGLSQDDISNEEFEELLTEQIKQSKSFSKGALAATGVFMFLEFLG